MLLNKYDLLSRWTGQKGPRPWDEVRVVNGAGGLPEWMTNVAGVVSYSYDQGWRVSAISSPADTFNFSYNPTNGLVAGVSCVTGGISAAYAFDGLDRLTDITWKDSSDNVLRSFGYQYNAVGMITQKVTTINGQLATNSYTYDSLNRLTSESSETSEGTPQTTWTYDLAGNRIQMADNGITVSYTLGAGNRLTSWGVNGTNSWMQYDNAGNVTSICYNASNQFGLTWDSRYRLTSVATNGAVAESYEYDALDRRISISDGTTTNYLIYDGVHVIAEVGTSGSLVRSYTYGPGIDNILSMTVYGGTTQTYYYVKDHLGSVQALTDSSGTIVESYQYDAWGNVLGVFDGSGNSISNQQSQIGNRYCWQGREYSWKTGLYYFRARWYEPVTGRWLSNDPIGISGGLNQYAFCANNPINFTDPLGLFDLYADMSATATAGWNRGGFWGGVQGNFYSGVGALLNTIGGQAVQSTASLSGSAAGQGRTGAAIGWGTASGGLIALNAVTFGRVGSGIPNFGTQFQTLRSAGLYEVGSLTLPRAAFNEVAGLSATARGTALLEQYGGFWGVMGVARQATWADWLATLGKGPTPAGWLGVFGLTVGLDQGVSSYTGGCE